MLYCIRLSQLVKYYRSVLSQRPYMANSSRILTTWFGLFHNYRLMWCVMVSMKQVHEMMSCMVSILPRSRSWPEHSSPHWTAIVVNNGEVFILIIKSMFWVNTGDNSHFSARVTYDLPECFPCPPTHQQLPKIARTIAEEHYSQYVWIQPNATVPC